MGGCFFSLTETSNSESGASNVCGLVGVLGKRPLAGLADPLRAAADAAHHRGPDGAGYLAMLASPDGDGTRIRRLDSAPDASLLARSTLALGHRRLAIIDLSEAGNQPLGNDAGSHWIVYNGEIYNHVELREELRLLGHGFRTGTDTEVLLRAYEQWGPDCVHRFNGMWAFAILDLHARRLFCSRDRFGIKPLYLYADDDYVAFASEIKQLLCFPFVPRRANERAVSEYLAYAGVEYCEETFFDGIDKLAAGTNLLIDLTEGTRSTHRYYAPDPGGHRQIRTTEAADEFRDLLADSIRLRLRSDVAVGSCLSGGLDSSSIVCLMNDQLRRHAREEVQRTFTCHFDVPEANEITYQREVVRHTGVRSHLVEPTADDLMTDLESLVRQQEEPVSSSSVFAQWKVFELAATKSVKVMLDGQGADEQLAGYVPLLATYLTELRVKRRLLLHAWELIQFARLHGGDGLWQVEGGLSLWLRRALQARPPNSLPPPSDWMHDAAVVVPEDSLYLATRGERAFDEDEILSNSLFQLVFLNNLQALLRYEDRSSMAFSIEARVPFLDHRLVEFLLELPSDRKIRNGYTKRVLRDGMAGVLPERIRWRVPKLGFATPERRWLSGPLRPLVVAALDDPRVQRFVAPEAAHRYLRAWDGVTIADSTPWRWLNVHLWMNAYELD